MSDLTIIALVMSGYLYLAGCVLAIAVPDSSGQQVRLWLVPLWPVAIGVYLVAMVALGVLWLATRARDLVFK